MRTSLPVHPARATGKETVDLGVPEPCGGDSMGQCIRGLPLSEWEARCKAGKVP